MRRAVLAAIGIVLAASAYAQPVGREAASQPGSSQGDSAPQQQPNRFRPLPLRELLERIVGALEADNNEQAAEDERKREQRELAAQEGMTKWAKWMFWALAAQTGLTFFGLLLIGRILLFTRDAAVATGEAVKEAKSATAAAALGAEHAETAVEITRSTAIRQLRPYVYIVSARISDVLGKPIIKIKVKNFGQTPAYQLSFFMGGALRDYPLNSSLTRDSRARQVLFDLGPSNAFETEMDWDGPIREDDKNDLAARNKAIYIFGRFEYRDAFDNPWFSEFRFVEGGEFPLRPKGGEMRLSVFGGNNAT